MACSVADSEILTTSINEGDQQQHQLIVVNDYEEDDDGQDNDGQESGQDFDPADDCLPEDIIPEMEQEVVISLPNSA